MCPYYDLYCNCRKQVSTCSSATCNYDSTHTHYTPSWSNPLWTCPRCFVSTHSAAEHFHYFISLNFSSSEFHLCRLFAVGFTLPNHLLRNDTWIAFWIFCFLFSGSVCVIKATEHRRLMKLRKCCLSECLRMTAKIAKAIGVGDQCSGRSELYRKSVKSI